MGKFVNSKGKIRILAYVRCGMYIYVCRKGKGIYLSPSVNNTINMARCGYGYTMFRENYETVNRAVKNNPILKLRDAQPDGLLIDQKPSQLKLGI